MLNRLVLAVLACLSAMTAAPTLAQTTEPTAHPPGTLATKPLFRDPTFDGAADPVLVYNKAESKWLLYYTNRRAKGPLSGTAGVAWVHGTDIGIAESSDGGATWKYRGIAHIDIGPPDGHTYWAPDVFEHDGTYHMLLTVVPGIFDNWNHPRDIVHLTSSDGMRWKHDGRKITLASDRVIDAAVYRLPDGTWRMWYNNERAGKSTFFADSKDLLNWEDKGSAKLPGDRGEGPKVFRWKNYYWLVIDAWNGLGVYRSDDLATWTRQPANILQQPGRGPEDGVMGQHPDVQVSGDRAWAFYFVHPGRTGAGPELDTYDARRSLIQVVELQYDPRTMEIIADRDAPTYVDLKPPAP